MKEHRKAIWKRILRWFFFVLAGVIALLVILLIVLRTQWGQDKVRQLAVHWLGKKLNTRVAIGGLKTNWLSDFELTNLYLEDPSGKPLASIGHMQVGYNLVSIIRGDFAVQKIAIDRATLQISRQRSDSNFNFNFIVKAFSKDTVPPLDTTRKKTNVKLGLISLNQVRFEMDDRYGGQHYTAYTNYIRLQAKEVDIDQLDFKLKYLVSDSVIANVLMYEPFKKDSTKKTSGNSSFTISSDSVGLAHTTFHYYDSVSEMQITSRAGILAGNKIAYDLLKMSAAASLIELTDHSTIVSVRSNSKESGNTTDTSTGKPFTFDVKNLLVQNNGFVLNDLGKAKGPNYSIDFAHLNLQTVNIKAANIKYDGKTYRAAISNLSGGEKSGFRLQQASVDALYSEQALTLQGLKLKTTYNELNGDLAMTYKSLDEISKTPSQTKINLAIRQADLRLDELLFFNPSLSKNTSFQPLIGKEFLLSTKATGALDNIHIPDLYIKQGNTLIRAGADVYHLPDTKRLMINLYLKQFEGSREALLSLLPKKTIPDSLLHYIPNRFSLTGTYKGGLQNMVVDLHLNSDYGSASVSGMLKNITNKHTATYNLTLNANRFQLDKLMNDTLYGVVSGNIQVSGTGLDIHSAIADGTADISEVAYHGYTYRQIRMKGKLSSNTIHADLQSDDPNAQLSSVTTYNMSPDKGSFETNTHITNLDLLALRLMKDTLALSGDIVGNIPRLDTNQLVGDLYITNLRLKSDSLAYPLDSIVFKATYERDSQFVSLRTPFLKAELNGQYSISGLIPAARTIANRYIYAKSMDTVFHRPVVAKFVAHVNVPDSIVKYIPGLKKLTPFDIVSEINTLTSSLKLYADVERVVYKNYIIDTFSCNIASFGAPGMTDQLLYSFGMERLIGPGFRLNNSVAAGTASRGIINGSIKLMGQRPDDLRYHIPYKITNDPGRPFLQIPDSLTIDGDIWNVSRDNIVYLNIDRLQGSRLKIFKADQSIFILADSSRFAGLPLKLELLKFNLDNISNIIVSDTSFASGIVSGEVAVQSFAPLGFTGDIKVENLKLRNTNAGDLVAKITSAQGQDLNVDVNLKGYTNNVSLIGTYNFGSQASALKLHLDPLDVQTAAPFVSQYLNKLAGRLRGDLAVSGSLANPRLNGKLVTDSIETVYSDYGTTIRLPAGELLFDDSGVKFENFAFLDSAGKRGRLDGSVLTTDYRNFKYDLTLKLDSFQVVGRRRTLDQPMYGPTNANVNLTLKTDDANVLQIKGRAAVLDKSSFTYVYTPEVTSQKGEGLVEFFDPATAIDSLLLKQIDQAAASAMKVAIDVSINLTSASSITIMMDEDAGDHLLVKGSADLNYARSADGRQNLTGIYTVESGEYDLSIASLIRKTFTIQKGSTLSWSGDPLKADLNITALYRVKTSAGELVNDIQSVPGIDKQKLNFEVFLILTGQLLKPDINFRLDMEENDQAAFNGIVYNRIKQVNSMPNELNKQVMGLLALNRFIADNPFSSLAGGGSSMQTQAFATAGNLVTQQLTDLVGQFVKDVNIDFALDVNDNFTTGQAVRNTNLKVGVTKQLANNRLSVYVGSSFALEGQNQNANALSGLAGDVTVEYQLTRDGKYRLRAYRINQNDLTFEGAIVKTGVTFVVVLEFNKLKNAFRKSRKPTL